LAGLCDLSEIVHYLAWLRSEEGVCPMILLKTRGNRDMLSNTQSRAMVESFRLVAHIRCSACAAGTCGASSVGVREIMRVLPIRQPRA
jgi:hypothetical protein